MIRVSARDSFGLINYMAIPAADTDLLIVIRQGRMQEFGEGGGGGPT